MLVKGAQGRYRVWERGSEFVGSVHEAWRACQLDQRQKAAVMLPVKTEMRDCGQARVRIATERVAPGTQASSRQRSITCSSAAVRVQIWKALTRFEPHGHIGDPKA